MTRGKIVGPGPENEADHFIECAACGRAFDCRELEEVLHHEMPDHEPRKVN